MADALELIGGVLVVVGVALYAFPLALIVTGLLLVAAAWSLPADTHRAGVPLSKPPRTGR